MSIINFSNLPERPWINKFDSANGAKTPDKNIIEYKQRTKDYKFRQTICS